MKRRRVTVRVSDHAVLRWLDRQHGLDVGAVKALMADMTRNGAELGALAVCIDNVRLVLKQTAPDQAVVVTTLSRSMAFRPGRKKGGGHD